MNNKLSWFNGLNKKDRKATVFSMLWIIIVTLVVMNEANSSYYPDEIGESLQKFLLFGILPVFSYWGYRWIKSGSE